jgi:hypothetical protein
MTDDVDVDVDEDVDPAVVVDALGVAVPATSWLPRSSTLNVASSTARLHRCFAPRSRSTVVSTTTYRCAAVDVDSGVNVQVNVKRNRLLTTCADPASRGSSRMADRWIVANSSHGGRG